MQAELEKWLASTKRIQREYKENTKRIPMKLCPLFESIEMHWCDVRDPRERYLCNETLRAANEALPREAIEAAIGTLHEFMITLVDDDHFMRHRKYIEQLRAMLPEEEK